MQPRLRNRSRHLNRFVLRPVRPSLRPSESPIGLDLTQNGRGRRQVRWRLAPQGQADFNFGVGAGQGFHQVGETRHGIARWAGHGSVRMIEKVYGHLRHDYHAAQIAKIGFAAKITPSVQGVPLGSMGVPPAASPVSAGDPCAA